MRRRTGRRLAALCILAGLLLCTTAAVREPEGGPVITGVERDKAAAALEMRDMGEAASMEPTPEVQSFTKRRVKNLAELKEKILILDAGFDDVAVELVKNALCTIIQRTYRVERLHAYFSRINGEEMEFAIFLPRKPEPVYHSTKLEVYRQSQEVLRSLDFVDPQGFVTVNAKLARQLLEEYQNI